MQTVYLSITVIPFGIAGNMMTLSLALYKDTLRNPCPFCGTVHTQTGKWFATVAKYQCYQCDTTVKLSYQRKIEIFALHQAIKDNLGT